MGVDWSPEMVALAMWRNRRYVRAGTVSVRAGSATAIPAGDGAFGVTWSAYSCHHWDDLGVAGFQQAAAEEHRVGRRERIVVVWSRRDDGS